MKLGILGGTFDPVHLGHIMMAEKARSALKLGKVLMIPAGKPMAKPRSDITPAGHRLAMLELAVDAIEGIEISRIEIDRPGPSYTVDTLEQLRKSGYEDDDIYFIVGMDSLDQIHTWYRPERLISLCRIAAITRPGYSKPDDEELEKRLPGLPRRVVFIEGMKRDISGTEVREKLAKGESVKGLLQDEVIEYIKNHRLYQGG